MKQPLSYVHPSAKVAKNVVIDPFTSIDGDVEIGEGTWICLLYTSPSPRDPH